MDEIWLTSEGTSRLKGFYKSITLSLIKNKHFIAAFQVAKKNLFIYSLLRNPPPFSKIKLQKN